MKKRFWIALVLSIVLMLVVPVVATTPDTATQTAAADTPVLDVAAKNLSLNNTIDLLFYVTIENGNAPDVRLMTWTKEQADYAYGTQEKILEPTVITTYKQKPCAIFYYTGLAAKQMADNVYVRAYVEDGGEKYFSDTDKYSILQYAYNKIHAASPDAKLVALLDGMLDYGAQAQTYFNYNKAHLANADFRLVKVANGLLSDQTDRGLFLAGETATLVANEPPTGYVFSHWTNSAGETVGTTSTLNLSVTVADTYTAVYAIPKFDVSVVNGIGGGSYEKGTSITLTANEPSEGYEFSHWTNSAGETVGTTTTLAVTVTENETYTANYKKVYSGGLEYTENDDGTLTVTGIGTCTDTELIIPAVHNGKAVTVIGANAFKNCSSLTSVTIPDSVICMKEDAFDGCTGLTGVYITDIVAWCNIIFEFDRTNAMSIFMGGITSNPLYYAKNLYLNNALATDIVISDGVSIIYNYAFVNCASLTSIVIPNGVTQICGGAFAGCANLATVEIPNSVKSISTFVFSNCSNLVSINFDGTVKQWNSIRFGDYYWNSNTGDYTVNCTDYSFAKGTTFHTIDVGHGEVTTAPLYDNVYASGTTITLNAGSYEPLTYYGFSHWEDSNGNTVGTTSMLNVTVTGDETYTAVFVRKYFEISIENGNGEIGIYEYGTELTFDASQYEPATGYEFSHWENSAGETVSTSKILTVTVTGDETYTVVYKQILVSVEVENGYILYNGENYGSSASLPMGSTVEIVLELTDDGNTYAFHGWIVNGMEGYSDPLTLDLYESYTVSAMLHRIETHTVTVVNGNGTTTSTYTVCQVMGPDCGYCEQPGIQLSADAPAEGSSFKGWKSSDSDEFITNDEEYYVYLAWYDCDMTFTAVYELDSYTITVVNGEGSGSYGYNEKVVLKATVPTNYQFDYWSNSAGEIVSYDAEYLIFVTASETYTAHFIYVPPYYTIKAVGGTINGSMFGSFLEGEQVTIVATTPSEGYVFSHWTNAAGETVGTTETLTVTVGASNETYRANLKKVYSGGLEYREKYDGTLEVIGQGTCTDSHIIIPSTYNGKAVTGIGDGAFYDGITTVTSVTIPSSIKYIGEPMLYCTTITSVYITDLVAWCNIDHYYGSGSNPLSYGADLYLNGELVTELVIPEGVTIIKESAFIGCSSITSVTIPDCVTTIDEWAFLNCDSLTTVTIGNGMTRIGDGAFAWCYDLTTINFNGTVQQWNAITFGIEWDSDTDNYTVNCIDYSFVKGTTFQPVEVVNGTITTAPLYDDIYASGMEITLVADAPATGYVFSHWTNAAGETVGTTATLAVTVSANETYTANYSYVPQRYTVRVTNGVINVGETNVSSGSFLEGTSITLVANTPADGYIFSYWKNSAGDVVGLTATLTVTVTGAETYTAVYVEDSGDDDLWIPDGEDQDWGDYLDKNQPWGDDPFIEG